MNNYRKTSLFLMMIGLVSLGGCEVPPPAHPVYYTPEHYNPDYSPVTYDPYPYPYYPYYYGPYIGVGPYWGGHHHHHR